MNEYVDSPFSPITLKKIYMSNTFFDRYWNGTG